jgi:hypothetical protein
LIALTDALVRATKQPTVDELARVHRFLRDRSRRIRGHFGTLFGARAFRDLVVIATEFAAREMG